VTLQGENGNNKEPMEISLDEESLLFKTSSRGCHHKGPYALPPKTLTEVEKEDVQQGSIALRVGPLLEDVHRQKLPTCSFFKRIWVCASRHGYQILDSETAIKHEAENNFGEVGIIYLLSGSDKISDDEAFDS
jgi:hypothetical protein